MTRVNQAYTTVVVPSVLVNADSGNSERPDSRARRSWNDRQMPKHGWNSKKDKRNK